MKTQERRSCKRYCLNYPIEVCSVQGEEGHLAEICDAGLHGMRLLLTDPAGLQVGTTVHLSCFSARTKGQRAAVELQCQVAWQDPNSLEVGLQYL